MELDVGADEVGGDIGQRRLAGDAPEIRVAVDQRPQPANMRMVGPVLRADVEFLVRGGDPAALVDELSGSGRAGVPAIRAAANPPATRNPVAK